MSTNALTIVELAARNIKRIKAVRIRPQGNLVKITGKNDQGKTSVIDAIWFALGGKGAAKGTPKPVRNGQKSAEVTLDLGAMKVKRTWTADGNTYLAVESADGTPIKSPQTVLDKLCGSLSFDPLAFSRQTPSEQVATLKAVAGVDFTELDNSRAKAYADRTLVNRQVERMAGALASMPMPDPELPKEEVSAADLLAEQERANQVERDRMQMQNLIVQHENRRAAIDSAVAAAEATIRRLQGEIAALVAEKARLATEIATAQKQIPQSVDVGNLRERMAEIEETNAQVRQAKERRAMQDALDTEKDRSRQLTEAIEQIDQDKRDVLAGATMPIAGLGMSEDGVTFDGIPFSQVSSSGQLKVSLAMAMALNPTVRVIRITDGSLLDDANMEVVREMCKGFQVWIEVVDDQTGDAWVIEDGEVASEPHQ